MSNKFDWLSDLEDQWEQVEPPTEADVPTQQPRKSARIEKVVVGLTLLAGIAFLVVAATRGFDEVTNSAVLQVEEDVLLAHQTINNSVLSNDMELFSVMLSRQDKQWHNIQRVVMRRRLFYDRAPLGLWLNLKTLPSHAELSAGDAVTIELSPDMESAQVVIELPYVREQEDGTLVDLQLSRTDIYRRFGDQWVLGPAYPAGYWGQKELASGGDILTVTYPERDRDLALRLSRDLDTFLKKICQVDEALKCSDGTNFDVTLSTDPASLLNLNDIIRRPEHLNWRTLGIERRQRQAILPTPGLVGYPVDEVAYQALLDGYAGWIATSFIYNQTYFQPLPFDEVVELLVAVQLSPPPPGGYNPFWAIEPTPISFPEQDIVLACHQEPGSPQLWHYDLAANIWSETLFEPDSLAAVGLSEASTGRLPSLAGTEGLTLWLDTDPLLDAIPYFQKPRQLRIEDIAPDPIKPERLFILARPEGALHDVYLFIMDLPSAQISFLDRWQDNGYRVLPMLIAANGRFLTITRYSAFNTYISIFDVERRARRAVTVSGRPYSRSDWSDDGQWLVIAAERMLWLIAPEYDYVRTVAHDIADCRSAAWISSSG